MKHCSVEIIREPTRSERIRTIYKQISGGIQINQEEDFSKYNPHLLSEARLIDAENQAKKIGPTDPDSEISPRTHALVLGPRRQL